MTSPGGDGLREFGGSFLKATCIIGRISLCCYSICERRVFCMNLAVSKLILVVSKTI